MTENQKKNSQIYEINMSKLKNTIGNESIVKNGLSNSNILIC